MHYMKDTADDILILSVNNIRVNKWWVDGSYACHKYIIVKRTGQRQWEADQYTILPQSEISTRKVPPKLRRY